jgi:Na+-transporting NADH:ubiquinone oxidoreductase subunit F
VDEDRKTIIINDGVRAAHVDAGSPLLFGLMSEGIFIPSACGGKGSCGQCRAFIKGGALPYTPSEDSLLSESDRRIGVHLCCQVRVLGDLSIEIPWKHLSARQYKARVAGLGELTAEIREVTLEVTGGVQFVPGQYVQIFLPGTESTPEPQYRAYSMASPPSSPERLVFMVRREPGGIVSPYLCDSLHRGQELAIRGPFGDFRLHDSGREVLFIAGGSGLAPFRSMLLTMAERAQNGRPPRKATLFFSGRTRKDLFLLEELSALEGSLPFRFVPLLSNPSPGERWDGERGGMPAVLDRRLDRVDNLEAYLCGSAGMVDACMKVLLAKRLPEEHIFFDKFL